MVIKETQQPRGAVLAMLRERQKHYRRLEALLESKYSTNLTMSTNDFPIPQSIKDQPTTQCMVEASERWKNKGWESLPAGEETTNSDARNGTSPCLWRVGSALIGASLPPYISCFNPESEQVS